MFKVVLVSRSMFYFQMVGNWIMLKVRIRASYNKLKIYKKMCILMKCPHKGTLAERLFDDALKAEEHQVCMWCFFTRTSHGVADLLPLVDWKRKLTRQLMTRPKRRCCKMKCPTGDTPPHVTSHICFWTNQKLPSVNLALGLIHIEVYSIRYTIRSPPQTRFCSFHATSLECRLWRRANRTANTVAYT